VPTSAVTNFLANGTSMTRKAFISAGSPKSLSEKSITLYIQDRHEHRHRDSSYSAVIYNVNAGAGGLGELRRPFREYSGIDETAVTPHVYRAVISGSRPHVGHALGEVFPFHRAVLRIQGKERVLAVVVSCIGARGSCGRPPGEYRASVSADCRFPAMESAGNRGFPPPRP